MRGMDARTDHARYCHVCRGYSTATSPACYHCGAGLEWLQLVAVPRPEPKLGWWARLWRDLFGAPRQMSGGATWGLPKDNYCSGYWRRDGRYVRPHWRR